MKLRPAAMKLLNEPGKTPADIARVDAIIVMEELDGQFCKEITLLAKWIGLKRHHSNGGVTICLKTHADLFAGGFEGELILRTAVTTRDVSEVCALSLLLTGRVRSL